MRRTLSISPRRSIAGMAHSSPIDERAHLLERAQEQVTLSSSIRASVWEIRVIAIS